MKYLIQSLLFLICLSSVFSCVSRKPLVKQQSNFTKGALLIEPEWRVKKNGVWFVAPLLGAAAGGAYGYQAEIFEGLESQEQNVAAYGGAGLLGGLLLAGALSKNSQKGKNAPVRAGDQNKWVRKYNKETVIEYHLLYARDDGRLLLAPEKLAGELRQAEKRHQSLLTKLESPEMLALEELASYRDFLRDDYFQFYPEEKERFTGLLVSKEADAAFAVLHERMSEIVNRPFDRMYARQLAEFPRHHQPLYDKISPSHRVTLREMEDEYMTGGFASYFERIRSKELSDLPMDDITSAGRVAIVYQTIVDDAGELIRLPVVIDMLDELKRLKTTIVTQNEDRAAAELRSLNNRNELETLKSFYLSNLEPTATAQRLERVYREVESNMIAEEKRREEQIRQQARREELRQINALMNETTLTGEPTEAQMRFALQSQINIKNGDIEQLENTRTDVNNPITAIFEGTGMILKNTRYFIDYFEKLGCEKSTKAGFECDYAIREIVKGGLVGSTFGSLQNRGTATIKNGRFIKANGSWMLVEQYE